MPELPEVETMRRGILAAVGSRIGSVDRCRCRRRPILIQPRMDAFRRRTVGQLIHDVERLGKRVALRLDSGDRIVFEPRMTGLVLVADPPSVEHLRFAVELTGGPIPHVWFWDRRGLGCVKLLDPSQFARLQQGSLGPDALEVTARQLRDRLGLSRRAVKTALLDQKAIAGIGNLYASEILHLARIHPQLRCDHLTGRQWRAVHRAMIEVLTAAIQYEGSTLADGTYRNALNNPGTYQNHHRVYDRAGQVCPSCGKGQVTRTVQTQRATFFCPNCQRAATT